MSQNHYIFVDFESVQDIDLALIEGKPVKVFLFIGEQQNKMNVELMMQVHRLHNQVQMIKMECAGKNALDFVLAHHTGLQTAADAQGYIHILSKDKGFDALVNHLKGRKTEAGRSELFAQIPVLAGNRKFGAADRLKQVKARLITMKKGENDSRPKKQKTLCSKIQEVFQKGLCDEEVQAVVCGLEQKRWITIAEEKVTYHF